MKKVNINVYYKEFYNLFKHIKDNIYNPCMVIDTSIDKVLDFSCINLSETGGRIIILTL